jgi:hypothetical protein
VAQKLAEVAPGHTSETAGVASKALTSLKNAITDTDQNVRLAAVTGLRDLAGCRAVHDIAGYELHGVFRAAAVDQHRDIQRAALLGLGFYMRRATGYLSWATAGIWAAALDAPDRLVQETAACLVLAHCGPAVRAYASGRELPKDNPEERQHEIARFEAAIRQARSILGVEDQIADIIGDYWRDPEGFMKGIGSEANRIRDVGEELWRRGEMDAMRRAHAEVVRHCPFPGVGRNLEIMWDGIGRWQG